MKFMKQALACFINFISNDHECKRISKVLLNHHKCIREFHGHLYKRAFASCITFTSNDQECMRVSWSFNMKFIKRAFANCITFISNDQECKRISKVLLNYHECKRV